LQSHSICYGSVRRQILTRISIDNIHWGNDGESVTHNAGPINLSLTRCQ
jgi:hypothetical protein